MPSKKRCSRCRKTKPASDFYRRARSKDGLQAYCKACSLTAVNEFQKREGKSIVHRATKYGLTKNEVRLMMQIPICQACGEEIPDSYSQKFDHCHEAGHFRGVLCHPCNMACQGNSPAAAERLAKCIDYLRRDMERLCESA